MNEGPQKPKPPSDETIRRGYETGNPTVRGMTMFLIGFVVSMALSILIMCGLYWLLWSSLPGYPRSPLLGDRRPVPAEPLEQPKGLRPPPPRLQPSGSMGEWSVAHTPEMDFKEYRERQRELLNGWSVDLWSGAITMPIRQAMALAVDRLPVKPALPKHLPRPNYSGGFEP